LRPTVFGAVDRLITNAALIAVVGGGGSAHAIVLTGVAGLVAGAFSMGTGEYVSVTNQNELVNAKYRAIRAALVGGWLNMLVADSVTAPHNGSSHIED